MTETHGGDLGFDLLSAYLDGELGGDVRATVEVRLSESPEWRVELETIRAARDAVRALPTRDAPPGFWDDVRSAVVDDEVSLAPGARRHRRFGRVAGAVAAAAALIAVVVMPGRPEVRPNVAAVVTQHGAQSVGAGDPISTLAPVGPLAGLRR